MTSTKQTYTPEKYWEGVLREHLDERGVAYPHLPLSFNRAFYRAQIAAVTQLTSKHDITADKVLDIGAGSGVWIEYWERAGSTSVSGLDLTETAVEGLRKRFPSHDFQVGDIGAENLDLAGHYDAVSAMSVLLHITNDDRWQRAWKNIATLLRPGGHLILMEPILMHDWFGRPFDDASNSRARKLEMCESAARAAGLQIIETCPATVLLCNPIDTRSRATYLAMWFYWAALERLVKGSEPRGKAVGSALGALDVPLRRVLPGGPTAKLLLARRIS
jgi:2-polyprenyl-3-methyl-5-hydroxy-6-metoxy-1,4-benzoquinol methylase